MASSKEQRRELAVSVPEALEEAVRTRRGFVGELEVPMAVRGFHTEGGEVRLDLEVDADWVRVEDQVELTAFLDPLQAVVVGERLAAAGRRALGELVSGLKE